MNQILLRKIREAAVDAARIYENVSPDRDSASSKVGHANFVTVYDARVQEFLIAELKKILPEAHFVGEEEGKEIFLPEYKTGYTFVIDPIDGTSNFMKGYRPSATSIALLKDGQPYIGVIINPYTKQIFYAQKGEGAFVNEEPLRTSSSPLSESLVSIGTSPYYEEEVIRGALDLAFYYLKKSIDVRRSGSAAFDLCCVASGCSGMFFEPRLGLWDYAAGALIVTEAGGTVTDLYGNPLSFDGPSSLIAVSEGVAMDSYLPPEEMIRLSKLQ